MAYIPWTEKELADVIKTLGKSHTLSDAAVAHNAKWKTGRAPDTIQNALVRHGKGVAGKHLLPQRRLEDKEPENRVKNLVSYIKRRGSATVAEVCDALDISPKRLREMVDLARAMDFQLDMPTDDHIALSSKTASVDRLAVHNISIEPVAGHVYFAVASDLHFASKMHRGECLSDFVDIAMEDFKVSRIFVPGDVFAGINMYPGQLNEIECWGHEHQLECAVKNLPKRDGLVWDIIGGNHDESLMKAAAADIIKSLARVRPDVKQYGFYQGLIDIWAPGGKYPLKVELFHPDKAGAYAITYHVQKAIEQMPPGMKPHIILVGHEHQANHMPDYRGVSGLLCGCFEDQTLYLKRKHLSPAIGGWIFDVGVDRHGSPRTLTTTWVKYFHSRRGPLRGRGSNPDGEVRLDRSMGLPVG